MSSGRFAGVAIAITVALVGCDGNNPNLNKPDPNPYTLRFEPVSVSQTVGTSGMISMFASRTGGNDVSIRVVEWAVADSAIATLTGSTVSTEGPIHASIIVTCEKAGDTTVSGTVTLGFEQQLTDKLSVTCTAPPQSATSDR
jgi:hypothetical protein